MGMNIQKGLEGLSQGLGALTEHAIYKDEVARRERLEAAQQAFQERQMALQEKAFMAGEERHKESMGFQREQFEFSKTMAEREAAVAETEANATAKYRGDITEIQRQRNEMIAEQKEAEAKLRKLEAENASEEQRYEAYGEQMERNEDRTFVIKDAITERLNSPQYIPPDPEEPDVVKDPVMKELTSQLQERELNSYKLGVQYGMLDLENFEPEDQEMIQGFMRDQNVDLPKALMAFSHGEIAEIEPEQDAPAPGPEKEVPGASRRGGSGSLPPGPGQTDTLVHGSGGSDEGSGSVGQFIGRRTRKAVDEASDPYFWLNRIQRMFNMPGMEDISRSIESGQDGDWGVAGDFMSEVEKGYQGG